MLSFTGLLARMRDSFIDPVVIDYEPEEERQDEWQRNPERRKRMEMLKSGELVEDEESPGRLAVHWAPRRPKATLTPPSTPGFYPMRRRGTLHWTVVEVIAGPDGALWWAAGPREQAKRVDDPTGTKSLEWGNCALLMPIS